MVIEVELVHFSQVTIGGPDGITDHTVDIFLHNASYDFQELPRYNFHARVYSFSSFIREQCLIEQIKDNDQLFDDQIILDGFDPLDAASDFDRFINRFLRIDEAAQLNGAFVALDTNLK